MLSEKMQTALNRQINAEFFSSYLYLAMAAQAEAKSLGGFAKWFRTQSQEELVHGMKLFQFVNERGGRVILDAIDKPETEWAKPLDMFQDTYEHEQKVTALIYDLANLAQDERDRATGSFLNWFIDEQVEEEASADEILQKLKLAGDEGAGLFMIDAELAQRTFVYPTTLEGDA